MKGIILLLLALFVATPSHSQHLPCTDDGSVILGSFPAGCLLYPEVQMPLQSAATSGQVLWEFIVERTACGETRYHIDAGSIQFLGACDEVDMMTAAGLLDLLAVATLREGIAAGHTLCGLSTSYVDVVAPSSLLRSGSGVTTRFIAGAAPGCCTRTYGVVSPDGAESPQITPAGGSGCSSIAAPEEPSCSCTGDQTETHNNLQ